MLNRLIKYFLVHKEMTVLILVSAVVAGIAVAPFGWKGWSLLSDPVPVDAMPDIGENQQIVFTAWDGHSPQDIEDQVSSPLTAYLLGIAGVKSVRSSSMFGFSSIYVIFSEEIDFYWARARIVEKLSALPLGSLPKEVRPRLGPDATALGQVYWYTIEGRDERGATTGGWDLHEIRAIQDTYVKYGLHAAEGVSEVASIGGYLQEYQVDLRPEALVAYNVPLNKVVEAIQSANRDVGAQTIEVNQAEYFVRGLGTFTSVEDIEKVVLKIHKNTPICIKEVAVVHLGPATRRGILDKEGAEAVGGVVVSRFGTNAREVIANVKAKVSEIAAGMPKKMLDSGVESQLTIVPFYDRSILIDETLGTLEDALSLEMLMAMLVVLVMMYHLRASLLVAGGLPVAVLMVFIGMRCFEVEANIMALSGLVIAIGTMVDLGIIVLENIIRHIEAAPEQEKRLDTIYRASAEVSTAILTAVSTTIVSFIPVFALQATEGKLFEPLAFTKIFALMAALVISLFILPTCAYWFFGAKVWRKSIAILLNIIWLSIGVGCLFLGKKWEGLFLLAFSAVNVFRVVKNFQKAPKMGFLARPRIKSMLDWSTNNAGICIIIIGIIWLLSNYWLPLGAGRSFSLNVVFIVLLMGLILGAFRLLQNYYTNILRWCLAHKATFLSMPALLILLGCTSWIGADRMFGFMAKGLDSMGLKVHTSKIWSNLSEMFPGIGREFMPALNEGSFLLMPTTATHAGTEYSRKVLKKMGIMLKNVPEVELMIGKAGRVDSALDPAPISMYENIINYKPEYRVDKKGRRKRFKVDDQGRFLLSTGEMMTNEELLRRADAHSALIEDDQGHYFRNWRPHIHSPDDIWEEIVAATTIPGLTLAPKLQPIETRLIMLQTGMRAPMGIKIYGADLKTIETFGMKLADILRNVPAVKTEAVFADQIEGKPYLHLKIDRNAIARHGLSVAEVQEIIETAIGGRKIASVVKGRSRLPVRVRYPRELREDVTTLGQILVPTPMDTHIPMRQLVDFEYVRGPQVIRSEDTFLVGHVLFDKKEGFSETAAVQAAEKALEARIEAGELLVPEGISYAFSGNYENLLRAEQRLSIIIPIALIVIFLLLYAQFRSVSTALMVFSGVAMALSGGFIVLWLYGQEWFADFSMFGTNMRDLFHMDIIRMSVAVWVGFIALFGVATDDGVLLATYLDQKFKERRPNSLEALREAVVEAGFRRIRPALMTVATTMIVLLPVLTSSGRGSDVMIPMALPSFGGMAFALVSVFIVPVLYSFREERKLKKTLL